MVSARYTKLAALSDPGADERERGQVRGTGKSLHWYDVEHNIWIPAVYHSAIRRQLLNRASNNGQYKYAHTRKRGRGEDDETAFHPEQQHWNGERQHWGTIRDDVLNIFDAEDYVGQDDDKEPEVWYENDRIVIDHDNHPLKNFPDLPLTISTEVEGWLLETYMRLDCRIERMDIRARMPAQKVTSDGRKVDLFGLSAIGNKRWRFRYRHNLASWKDRCGTLENKAALRQTMPQGAPIASSTRDRQTPTVAYSRKTPERKKGVHPPRRGRRAQALQPKSKQHSENGIANAGAHTAGFDPPCETDNGSTPYWPKGSQSHLPQDPLGNIIYSSPSIDGYRPIAHSLATLPHQSRNALAVGSGHGPDTAGPETYITNSPETQARNIKNGPSAWNQRVGGSNPEQGENINLQLEGRFGDQQHLYDSLVQLDTASPRPNPTIYSFPPHPLETGPAECFQKGVYDCMEGSQPGLESEGYSQALNHIGDMDQGYLRTERQEAGLNGTALPSAPTTLGKRKRNAAEPPNSENGATAKKRQNRGCRTSVPATVAGYPIKRLYPEATEGSGSTKEILGHPQKLSEQTKLSQTLLEGATDSRLSPYMLEFSDIRNFAYTTSEGVVSPNAAQVRGATATSSRSQNESYRYLSRSPLTSTATHTVLPTPSPQDSDYRSIPPTIPWEVQIIQTILEFTRQDLHSWMRDSSRGMQMPRTAQNLSYANQYRQLVNGFVVQWWQEHPNQEQPPPRLRCLEKWTGGWEGWKVEDLSPLY